MFDIPTVCTTVLMFGIPTVCTTVLMFGIQREDLKSVCLLMKGLIQGISLSVQGLI